MKRFDVWSIIGIAGLAALGSVVFFGNSRVARLGALEAQDSAASLALQARVLPQEGIVLPIAWDDVGARMVAAGVIDRDKFAETFSQRGGVPQDAETLLDDAGWHAVVRMTQENSDAFLDLFWAFGLANKNQILEKGAMQKYGDPGRFASTGGWTLARGDAMEHFSAHQFVALTPAQQASVERVAQNIYRPCCDNPTSFPDCNHGMAMLGLLELMAANNVSEADMYKVALQVNAFWFPDTYLAIAKYFSLKGIAWKDVNPEWALGRDFSSAAGYANVLQFIGPSDQGSGSSCTA